MLTAGGNCILYSVQSRVSGTWKQWCAVFLFDQNVDQLQLITRIDRILDLDLLVKLVFEC